MLRVSVHAKHSLFARVGGVLSARKAGDEGMDKFIYRTPCHVARYGSDCMQLRKEKAESQYVVPDTLWAIAVWTGPHN